MAETGNDQTDLSEKSGVSKSSISRVLNNPEYELSYNKAIKILLITDKMENPMKSQIDFIMASLTDLISRINKIEKELDSLKKEMADYINKERPPPPGMERSS